MIAKFGFVARCRILRALRRTNSLLGRIAEYEWALKIIIVLWADTLKSSKSHRQFRPFPSSIIVLNDMHIS